MRVAVLADIHGNLPALEAVLGDMAALLGDPQVMRYYLHPKSRGEASAWRGARGCTATTALAGGWLRCERGEFVGDCGLDSPTVDGLTEIEVGYHVRTALQGRGLATEAAAACRDYARDVLGLKRLIAIIDLCNRPSQRVAEQLGLVVERRATTMAAGAAPAHSRHVPG